MLLKRETTRIANFLYEKCPSEGKKMVAVFIQTNMQSNGDERNYHDSLQAHLELTGGNGSCAHDL